MHLVGTAAFNINLAMLITIKPTMQQGFISFGLYVQDNSLISYIGSDSQGVESNSRQKTDAVARQSFHLFKNQKQDLMIKKCQSLNLRGNDQNLMECLSMKESGAKPSNHSIDSFKAFEAMESLVHLIIEIEVYCWELFASLFRYYFQSKIVIINPIVFNFKQYCSTSFNRCTIIIARLTTIVEDYVSHPEGDLN